MEKNPTNPKLLQTKKLGFWLLLVLGFFPKDKEAHFYKRQKIIIFYYDNV